MPVGMHDTLAVVYCHEGCADDCANICMIYNVMNGNQVCIVCICIYIYIIIYITYMNDVVITCFCTRYYGAVVRSLFEKCRTTAIIYSSRAS
jgi:hypothetical protein